ncbi:MAG TPA: malonyl-CoA synthase [Burkholderiaceae bacterium]|jgi:malonyl-CoA/methylmalonyl-CoA synthetase
MTMNANLFSALRGAFPADLDAVAIEAVDAVPPRLYSWRDLERTSARLANLLASLALPPASRVAVQTDKSVEALMLYLAVLRTGHIYLPLNTAYQAAEIEYFVGNAEPAVVVCNPRNLGWTQPIATRAGCAHVFTLADDGSGTLMERAAPFDDRQTPAVVQAGDLASIIYTSGTTGRSKGAMLTHANLLSNARTLKRYWGWQPNDVLIHALPIFHVHGLFIAIHGALLNGSKMIWFGKFDPKLAIAQMARATVFMGVPTLYGRMLAEPTLTRAASASMRLFISGSAPLLVETFDAWTERTGHVILERYGMSETAMLTSNPCRASDGLRRRGTVGPALPEVGVRAVDYSTDPTGTPCPAGAIGNLEVRGPNVFAGYWRMPEKTREEFTADGWFKTGDVGKIEADGYVTIVGRSKDLIISGGYNVYPAEIEGFINEMPGVAESAVIGLPHPDFGEAVVAVVVGKPGAALDSAAIVARMKRDIANFKVPKQVYVVDELPRNAMGKVQKNLLRDRHKSLFA